LLVFSDKLQIGAQNNESVHDSAIAWSHDVQVQIVHSFAITQASWECAKQAVLAGPDSRGVSWKRERQVFSSAGSKPAWKNYAAVANIGELLRGEAE
jgi:hypothetical protein